MLGLFNVKECSASFKTLKQEATGGGLTKRPEYLVGLSTVLSSFRLLDCFYPFKLCFKTEMWSFIENYSVPNIFR